MQQADGVKALMEYECRSQDEIFSVFPGTDIHVWPYLRRPFGQAIARIEFPREPPIKLPGRRQVLKRAVATLIPREHDASHTPQSKDLLFVVAGRTRSTVNGESMNWLTDYFARDLASKSAVIQYRALPKDGPSLAFADTYSMHRAELSEDIRASLRPLSEARRRSTVDLAMAIAEEIDFPLDESSVMVAAGKAIRHQARVVGMRGRFRRILDRVKPRHMIMDGTSYGGSRAIQVREAKARGVHVSELQHGWIGPSHGAYNFGSAAWDDRLFQYLPDTLLTFGDHWSRSVVTPSQTVSVGKPHIEELAASSPAFEDRPNVALIVSGIYRRDEMLRYATTLRDALPNDWTVLVRPHPFELPRVSELYGGVMHEPQIEIDLSADVYTSLGRSKIVFGYASTVMYEALQFGCVPVIFDSPLAEHYVSHPAFDRLVSGEDGLRGVVAEMLTNGALRDASDWELHRADVWAPSGVDRFRAFISE